MSEVVADEEVTEDFDSILEQVRAEVEAVPEPEDESEESSEGPAFEEEETEQEVDTQEESEDGYEDSDSTEDEGELDTEDSPDAEAEEEEEKEEKEEGEEDEGLSELDQMRQQLSEERERNRQWQEAFRKVQQQPKKQGLPDITASPQQRPPEADQLEEAFRLQLFGTPTDKESYDALPAGIKAKAQEAFKRHSHEETLNSLYPERRYAQQIRWFVQKDIQDALGGLTQDFHARKAKEVFSQYEDQVRSPEDRRRLLEVMSSIPGSESNDWRTQERVLDLAVQQVVRERELGDFTSRERELEMRERQLKQSRGTRSSTKGKRGRRRSRSQEKTMESGDDMLAFARSLEKEIRNGR